MIRWDLIEPPQIDLQVQQMLQPGARPGPVHKVSWLRLRAIQEWDAATNRAWRMLPWLSARHFHRNCFDRMNVGMALHIMSMETVRVLCYLRTQFL